MSGSASAAISPAAPSGGWMEGLAADFTSSLDVAARRMMLEVCGAGESGIHRSALCQRADLTPAQLRSQLVSLSHAVRRFERRRGGALPRPVVPNTPLQSYCIDPDFAAALALGMFGERMPGGSPGGSGSP